MKTHTNLVRSIIFLAILCSIALFACNAIMGPLNHDEGWYLLAAKNTFKGLTPYKDFAYTQAPIMPYVYGIATPLWLCAGVLGGRVFTLTLSLIAIALFAITAYKLSPKESKAIAVISILCLLGLSPIYTYFTTIPKTYALCSLFLALFAFFFSSHTKYKHILCAIFLSLATGTRISFGILLALVGVYLLCHIRNKEYGNKAWLSFGIAGGLSLAIIFAPFVIQSFDNFIFCQSYHTSRTNSSFLNHALLMCGFISRLLQAYFPIILVILISLLVLWARKLLTYNNTKHALFFLLCFVVTLFVHISAPFPYDDYQTPAIPFLALCATLLLTNAINGLGSHITNKISILIFISSCCFAISSPMCMNWVSIRQDRFWFEMQKRPSVLVLKDVGKYIRSITTDEDIIFTQDAYIAVESNRNIVKGMELGPFSMFPDISTEEAKRYNITTPDLLKKELENGSSKYAIISGYTFALSCPSTDKTDEKLVKELLDIVNSNFTKVKEVEDFGQGFTKLEIFRRNEKK